MSKSPKKPVLIAYSMGGRAALHVLRQAPEFWRAAILVSTNPGLKTSEEKIARRASDEKWSRQFLSQEWTSSIQKWNSQPAFRGSRFLSDRSEENFSREILSQLLTKWSLSQQEDFRPFLHETQIPILWVSGQNDEAYCSIGDELAKKSRSLTHVVMPEAGHRVPWDVDQAFVVLLKEYLGDLKMI